MVIPLIKLGAAIMGVIGESWTIEYGTLLIAKAAGVPKAMTVCMEVGALGLSIAIAEPVAKGCVEAVDTAVHFGQYSKEALNNLRELYEQCKRGEVKFV